jgi:hypothetical protein
MAEGKELTNYLPVFLYFIRLVSIASISLHSLLKYSKSCPSRYPILQEIIDCVNNSAVDPFEIRKCLIEDLSESN